MLEYLKRAWFTVTYADGRFKPKHGRTIRYSKYANSCNVAKDASLFRIRLNDRLVLFDLGQTECLNILLQRCPDIEVDARNASGFTPLMKAALQGRTKCAKILLFAGKQCHLSSFFFFFFSKGDGLRKEHTDRRLAFRCESDIERPRERIESGTVGQILWKVRVR